MNQIQLANIILQQSSEPHWMVDSNYHLVYANNAFQSFTMKGGEKQLNKIVFLGNISKDHKRSWRTCYDRALNGERVVIEEQFENKKINETHYYQITFEPITNGENKYFAVACHAKEISLAESNLVAKDRHIIPQRTKEKELNNLFETIPGILCLTDFSGRILKINKAGCSLLGYKEEDFLQENLSKFIYPDDLDNTTKELSRLEAGETIVKFENRYLTKRGDITWLSWYCNADSNEGVITATAKDITEEKKLKQLNKQASNLAKVGSWEYDLIKDDLFWSDEVHRLHETDPSTFVPSVERAIDFYKEEHKSFVSDVIFKAIKEGGYLDYEAAIISKSKKEKWIRVIASPEYVEGKCVKFIGSFQDITDLKEANVRLQSLSDNIPGVVFQYLLLPDGTDEFRYVSKGSKRIWSYTPEEVMNDLDLVWDQIKAGGDLEAVKKSIEESIENMTQWSIQYRILRPDGEKRIIQGSGIPKFGSDGTILFNSVALDVTEQAKNEELLKDLNQQLKKHTFELEHSNEKLREIAWTQSHIVRTPLSRILGIINLLENKEDLSKDLLAWLDHLKKSTQELDDIVKKIIKEANDFIKEEPN
ncbi:PAS domain S-box protein [Marivirga salinae]|uniref:histidine kinase n=1 Tax=Marivirga salinarum TaxID=3059078 RepID=A0AA51NC65_9BACT|nr:PAS domain S-box protein [Marivirga sp. BDSF4-3]WMN12264.1 PAS domain S-box protein [Marivirga sp. BDSF4-3]